MKDHFRPNNYYYGHRKLFTFSTVYADAKWLKPPGLGRRAASDCASDTIAVAAPRRLLVVVVLARLRRRGGVALAVGRRTECRHTPATAATQAVISTSPAAAATAE